MTAADNSSVTYSLEGESGGTVEGIRITVHVASLRRSVRW